MAAATLSAKVSADIGDFSRNLDSAGRRWEKFGRDLNQGANAMSKTFGSATGSLSSLSRGFETAGRAAGLFAGLDGIAGIASSMAMGGPVLAGIAAVSVGLTLFAAKTKDAKEEAEKFSKSLDVLFTKGSDLEGLKTGASVWQRDYDRADQALRKLLQDEQQLGQLSRTPEHASSILGRRKEAQLVSERDIAAQRLLAIGYKVQSLETLSAKDATKALADEMERVTRAAEKMNKGAVLEAWRLTQPGYIGGGVNRSALKLPTVSGINTTGLNPLNASDLDFDVVVNAVQTLNEPLGEQTSVLKAGFAELPNALGGVLGSLLGSLFGNNRGAQIGGGLGGAFGAGAGAFIAGKAGAGLGSMIGGALLPVVGSAIGGLLGGAIGGLFGSSKKHMDDLAYEAGSAAVALHHLTTEILNGAPGFRVAAARFSASNTMSLGSGGYFVEDGRGRGGGGNGTPIVLMVDNRVLARSVVNTLRVESQAQFGDSTRIAEVTF